jgi:hypothetical protein
MVLNECGGTVGIVLHLAVKLDTGDGAIVARRGKQVPAGWATGLPTVDHAKLENAVRAVAKAAPREAELGLAVDPDGAAIARVWWMPRGEAKKGIEAEHRFIDVKLGADGKARLLRDGRGDHMRPMLPVARRDVDGDRSIELILSDGCSALVLDDHSSTRWDEGGVVRALTENRCCGC